MARERRTRDLSSVRCIKDEDGKLLVEDSKVQERWRSYFYKLFNGERFEVSQRTKHLAQEEQQNSILCCPITREKVKEILRKMKVGKAVGPDSIPVEIWKSLGEECVEWLTDLFNVILKTIMMPQK